MSTTLLIYILTATTTNQTQVEYSNLAACNAGIEAIATTLDKLNETTNLGYALKCLPTNEVLKKH